MLTTQGRAEAPSCQRRLLFVGNSHTYQPKELGGVPQAVGRLAAALGCSEWEVASVVRGGADLLDLREEFETTLRAASEVWDTFVLQVGCGAEPGNRAAIEHVLQEGYAPLLMDAAGPGVTVLLYQTWSGPRPLPSEGDRLGESAAAYSAALRGAGVRDVRVAPVGNAFLALHTSTAFDRHIYPALWKDDMGHGSALAGALVALVIVLALGVGQVAGGSRQHPLGRIVETMLPSAWRTASPGFAGDVEVSQKGWRESGKGAPSEVMDLLANTEEDLPLSRYPPGMRTEKRDLGVAFGDALVAAASDALGPAGLGGQSTTSTCGESCSAEQTVKPRRWQSTTSTCGEPSVPACGSEQTVKPRRWKKSP